MSLIMQKWSVDDLGVGVGRPVFGRCRPTRFG